MSEQCNCRTLEQDIEDALTFRKAYLKANPQIKVLSMKDSTALWRKSTQELEALRKENDRLRKAIDETLEENAYLADGDNCTLIKLKQALGGDGV